MQKKHTKIIVSILVIGALVTLALFTVYPTKYSTPKKYEKNMFSGGAPMTKGKEKYAQKRRHDTKVRILDDHMASMGDFIFNSGGKTKIVANISLEFQNSQEGWFNKDDAKKEIIKRGVILRSAIIDTMMDNHGIRTNDDKIKAQLLDNLNYYLSDATATEIYFNKFIVHY